MTSIEDKKAVITRFYDEVVNNRNLSAIEDLEIHEFMDHRFPFPDGWGTEATHRVYGNFAKTPGGRSDCNLLVGEGNFVFMFASGTAIPPLGKKMMWDVIDLFHIIGDRMVEKWGIPDGYHRFQQLGQLPDENMRPVGRPPMPFSVRNPRPDVPQEELEGNKMVVWRYLQGVLNGKNLKLVDELVSSTYQDHHLDPEPAVGAAGARNNYEQFLSAFSQIWFKCNCIVAENDFVGVYGTAMGKHDKGEFLGTKATGKELTMSAMSIFRVADGKITERWGIFDRVGVMRQLGTLPASM